MPSRLEYPFGQEEFRDAPRKGRADLRPIRLCSITATVVFGLRRYDCKIDQESKLHVPVGARRKTFLGTLGFRPGCDAHRLRRCAAEYRHDASRSRGNSEIPELSLVSETRRMAKARGTAPKDRVSKTIQPGRMGGSSYVFRMWRMNLACRDELVGSVSAGNRHSLENRREIFLETSSWKGESYQMNEDDAHSISPS